VYFKNSVRVVPRNLSVFGPCFFPFFESDHITKEEEDKEEDKETERIKNARA
jgi:hypothetical protein